MVADPQSRPPVLAAILAGPTASGKTALAVELAQRLPIEVVSADSRQVYRHLHIGTAQPTAAERAAVPHHLVDFLELDETYDASRFTTDALHLFEVIRQRGHLPLVVGGAGFYLNVLRQGLFDSPFDATALQRVRSEVATWETDRMIEALQELDPQRLAAIHPNDRYRLSRALEICLASGRSVTQLTRERRPPQRRFLEFRMTLPRPELHARIAARTEAMLDAGWVDEVRRLLETHDGGEAGFATLGYPHVVSHLRGELTVEEMREKILVDTRQLARHQEVWFRKTPDAVELPVGDVGNVDALRRRLQDCPDLRSEPS